MRGSQRRAAGARTDCRACGVPAATRAARSTRTLGVMALVRVLSPQSEPEIAVVKSLLEAHDIPVFIHGRHLGSLLPGLQIGNYNTQSIMVPEECVTDALELLSDFRRDDSSAQVSAASLAGSPAHRLGRGIVRLACSRSSGRQEG